MSSYPNMNNSYGKFMKSLGENNKTQFIKCGCGENYTENNQFFNFKTQRHNDYMTYKRIHHSKDPFAYV